MTQDFGQRGGGGKSGRVPLLIGLGVVVVLGAIYGGYVWTQDRARAIALSKTWLVEGPPCPSLTRAAYLAQGEQAAKGYDFYDVRFARAAGNVSCEALTNDGGRGIGVYPICHFTSPDVLQITTDKGDFYFGPGLFGGVSVSAPHGEARCVQVSRQGRGGQAAGALAGF